MQKARPWSSSPTDRCAGSRPPEPVPPRLLLLVAIAGSRDSPHVGQGRAGWNASAGRPRPRKEAGGRAPGRRTGQDGFYGRHASSVVAASACRRWRAPARVLARHFWPSPGPRPARPRLPHPPERRRAGHHPARRQCAPVGGLFRPRRRPPAHLHRTRPRQGQGRAAHRPRLAVRDRRRVTLPVRHVGGPCPHPRHGPGGAVLVRPDRFVAWHAHEATDPAAQLSQALQAILGEGKNSWVQGRSHDRRPGGPDRIPVRRKEQEIGVDIASGLAQCCLLNISTCCRCAIDLLRGDGVEWPGGSVERGDDDARRRRPSSTPAATPCSTPPSWSGSTRTSGIRASTTWTTPWPRTSGAPRTR
jgi:hypothetical protein